MAGVEVEKVNQPLKYEPFNLDFKNKSFDPFVPKEQEADYLKKHNINFEFLPNGSLLIFGHLETTNRPWSETTFIFPTGSYLDPQGKSGTAHLVEHMFASDSLITAQKYGVDYYQATTYEDRIETELNGTSSPNVKKYGVWPVIPIIFEKFSNPTNMSKERFETEKQITLLENRQKRSDWMWHARKFMSTTVFDNENPIHASYVKQPQEVLNVTMHDVEDFVENKLVSQNFLIVSQTYGEKGVQTALKEELLSRVLEFPRFGKNIERINPALYARINTGYKNGELYEYDIPFSHDQILIYFHYTYPTTAFSFESIAQNTLSQLIGLNLFEYSRAKGISYDTKSETNIYGYSQRISGLSIQVPKIENYRDYAKELNRVIKSEVIEKTRQDIPHGMEMIKSSVKIQDSFSDTFTKLISVYNSYGRILDFEKEKAWFANFSEADLNRELDKLLSIDPAIFVMGDLD